MPTARGVTIALQSQYDALTIPEEPLPSSPICINLRSSSESRELDERRCPQTVEVGIPIYPCSQFWISYACPIPTTSASPSKEDDIHFYYFKLLAGYQGKCVVSWGVGKQDNWRGKTIFALFDTGTDFEGRKLIEKRGLFFPARAKGQADGFEIHVFRARGRKRMELGYEPLGKGAVSSAAIDLTNIGRVKRGERQRMYTYALVDPKDEPYVKFKYRFRSEPDGASSGSGSTISSVTSSLFVEPQSEAEDTPAQDRTKAKCRIRRLSIPPRTILAPSSRSTEPSPPIKHPQNLAEGGNEVDPGEQKRREWFARTPSPMMSRLFDKPTTPPGQKRKTGSSQLLKDVVSNALKGRASK